MAFRKKPLTNNPDDLEKVKDTLHDAAQDVTKAAEKFSGIPLNRFITKDELMRMRQEVEGVDDLFDKQEKDMLKDIAEVRVMKYDPSGRLTDVTDKVRPGDIRPEEIVDVRADRGLQIPRNADGKLDQEGALNLLTALLGGGRRSRGQYFDERLQKLQLDEMEAAINDAEKILEHWKK